MLWKCCKNIVDVAFFFFLIPLQISATIILFYFFPPMFGNAIVTIAIKKKNWFPYFGNGIATIRFSQFFFLPIFDNAIATIVTKKKISPYFGNGIATISLSIFFFSFHFGHSMHTGSRIGHRKFGIPVAEIQHFLSPPFSSSLSYFWLNFSNGNTKIQSFSSKSQISLNSSYNAY